MQVLKLAKCGWIPLKMTLMKYQSIAAVIFLAGMLFSAAHADETIEVTSYYPSPRAAYGKITVSGAASESKLATTAGATDKVLIGTTSTSSDSKLFVNGGVVVGVPNPTPSPSPSGSPNSKLRTNGGLQIQQVSTDPTGTQSGQIWLRTDLDDNGNPAGGG